MPEPTEAEKRREYDEWALRQTAATADTPKTQQQPEVRSGEWVEELEQKLERRIAYLESISGHLVRAKSSEAQLWLKQLRRIRADAKSSSTMAHQPPNELEKGKL